MRIANDCRYKILRFLANQQKYQTLVPTKNSHFKVSIKIISNETVSRDDGENSTQTRIVASSSIRMIIQGAPYIFHCINENCRDAPCIILMAFMLLLATIFVYFLHHHPYLVSFEMIFLLLFCITKQQYKAVSYEWMISSIPSHALVRGVVTTLMC